MNIKSKKICLSKLTFILCTAVCSCSRFGGIYINMFFNFGVAIMWMIISVAKFKHHKEYRIIGKKHFKLAAMPIILMVFFTLINWQFNSTVELTVRYYTRLISTASYYILALLYAYLGFCVFGKKVLDYLWEGLVLSYLFGSIIAGVIMYGPINVFIYLVFQSDTSPLNRVFEVHDITFAFGFYFLYYLFFADRFKANHRRYKLFVTVLFLYFGLKRIEIAALVVTFIAFYVIGRRYKDISVKSKVLSCAMITISFTYIWLIYSNALTALAERLGINFMGRLTTYEYMTRFFDFSPNFMGLGYSYVNKLIEKLQSQGVIYKGWRLITGLHSDILKKYIEIGFFPFIIWVWYSIVTRTNALSKYFSKSVAVMYLLSTVYMFVLYFTDNVFEYFVTTMIYFAIPLGMSTNYASNKLCTEVHSTRSLEEVNINVK